MYIEKAAERTFVLKICLKNVDEIDYRCQFHQCFTRAFVVPKHFWQLFSSFSLVMFGFCIKKSVHKMLMKLTEGLSVFCLNSGKNDFQAAI
jgi:hypothetical protein